jgi:hypothetical protein
VASLLALVLLLVPAAQTGAATPPRAA